MKPQPPPAADAPVAAQPSAGWSNFGNTAPFNISHDPATSLPKALRWYSRARPG
jgi:hypothetical protein